MFLLLLLSITTALSVSGAQNGKNPKALNNCSTKELTQWKNGGNWSYFQYLNV